MATHAPHGPAHAGTPPAKKKNYTPLALVIGFVFLVFVAPRFFKSKNSDEEKQKDNIPTISSSSSSKPISSYSYEKKVLFTGEYEDTVNIPAGFYVSIKEASGPYCLTNVDNSESDCSVGKEDISDSDKFTSENPNNKILRFKSTNSQDGYVILLLRSKI